MAERKSEELLALFDTARLDRRYWTTFGLLAGGTVLDYFDFFIVGFLIAQLGPEWHLTYGQSSTILLAAGIGAITGALIWGPLADQLGRKRQLVFGYLICAVGAGGISLIADGDWVAFAALRFIVGFGLAAGTVPSSTMILEITPTRVRTLVANLGVLFSTVGSFSASAMGATLYTWLGWRNVALLGASPVIVAALVMVFVPESVRWLVAKGRFAEAQRLVARRLDLPLDQVPLPTLPPPRQSAPATHLPCGKWPQSTEGSCRCSERPDTASVNNSAKDRVWRVPEHACPDPRNTGCGCRPASAFRCEFSRPIPEDARARTHNCPPEWRTPHAAARRRHGPPQCRLRLACPQWKRRA